MLAALAPRSALREKLIMLAIPCAVALVGALFDDSSDICWLLLRLAVDPFLLGNNGVDWQQPSVV